MLLLGWFEYGWQEKAESLWYHSLGQRPRSTGTQTYTIGHSRTNSTKQNPMVVFPASINAPLPQTRPWLLLLDDAFGQATPLGQRLFVYISLSISPSLNTDRLSSNLQEWSILSWSFNRAVQEARFTVCRIENLGIFSATIIAERLLLPVRTH